MAQIAQVEIEEMAQLIADGNSERLSQLFAAMLSELLAARKKIAETEQLLQQKTAQIDILLQQKQNLSTQKPHTSLNKGQNLRF